MRVSLFDRQPLMGRRAELGLASIRCEMDVQIPNFHCRVSGRLREVVACFRHPPYGLVWGAPDGMRASGKYNFASTYIDIMSGGERRQR